MYTVRLLILAGAVAGMSLLAAALAGAGDNSTPRFDDIVKQAGVSFVHLKGNQGVANIMDEAGPGFACSTMTETDGRTSTSSARAISTGGAWRRATRYIATMATARSPT